MAAPLEPEVLKKIIEKKQVIPPSYDRRKLKTESRPFCFVLKNVDGILLKEAKPQQRYAVRVSLFDLPYKQFFGRTWTGYPVTAKDAPGNKVKFPYAQNVYFHSPVADDQVALVVEVIGTSGSGNEDDTSAVSLGWGFIRPFVGDGKLTDLSSGSDATTRIQLHSGSPKAMLFLDAPLEGNPHLAAITGALVTCQVRTHKFLSKVMHLLPENCLLGTHDVVPGMVDGPSDVKATIPGDAFRKPRLLSPVQCFIEKIAINMKPSLERFEEEICRRLNDDRMQQRATSGDGANVEIVRRTLKVGIHNGWKYIAEPEVILMSLDATSSRHNSRSGKGHQRSASAGSTSSATAGSEGKVLIHLSKTEISGMLDDPMIYVVFTLLYDIAEATHAAARRASLVTSTVQVAAGWTAYCPLTQLPGMACTLKLLGGPGINPNSSLVACPPNADGSLVVGTLDFVFTRPAEQYNGDMSMLHVPQLDMSRPQSMASLQVGESAYLRQVAADSPLQGRPPSGRMPGSARPPHGIMMYGGSPSQSMAAGYPVGPGMPPPMVGPGVYAPGMDMYNMPPHDMQSPMVSARSNLANVPDLHEMAMVPLYHAPIMAVPPTGSGTGLTRAAYSKLYAAGFPPVLDRKGEAPEVADPADNVNFVLAKEEADRLQTNEIVLQFLAYSRMEPEGTGTRPAVVYFTFQFYKFPQVTTERLLLGKVEMDLAANASSMPSILQKLSKDGNVAKGPPGYEVKYYVDPAYMKTGESRHFLQHLSQHSLHIDVWDGESLLLIGSCSVDLKHLCRQGRSSVQVTYELDVVFTEYVEHDGLLPAGDMTRDAASRPVDVSTLLKGRLHLRLANVGYPAERPLKAGSSALDLPKSGTVIEGGLGNSIFAGGSLNTALNRIVAQKRAKAKPLTETNHELAQMLHSRRRKTVVSNEEGSDTQVAVETAEHKRKLSRMSAVRSALTDSDADNLKVALAEDASAIRVEKEEKARDLKMIEAYRHQSKRDSILSILQLSQSTEHTFHAAIGVAEFFEFKLKNPHSAEIRVYIESSDPELRVITDPREWRHFKIINNVATPVEEGLFNMDTKSGKPEVFLRPKESALIPIKYLTFRSDNTVDLQMSEKSAQDSTKLTLAPRKKVDDSMQSRTAKLFFRSTTDDQPVSILLANILPQPHMVDQTFRFYHPEQSFMKKSIRMQPLHTLPGLPLGGPGTNQVFVKCSDPSVVCHTAVVQPGEPHDIFIKVACGAAPQIRKFLVLIYTDPHMSKPAQVWQIYVHAMQRVDMAAVQGQTTRSTLMLRGTQTSRFVKCYPSHPGEMQVHPSEPFMLAANALQEIHVGVRPRHVGSKLLHINVVDQECHQLVRSWLVTVASQPPVVSKAFEISIPVGGGRGSNKKITFTNPYPHSKVFHLFTNRDDLLQFRDTRLDMAGGEESAIGLRFLPSTHRQVVDVMVFINDEEDKNEETFCVRTTYQ